jgi:hypothetical protein
MRGRRTHANAEPGTGTQYCSFATPPDRDDDKPNSKRINGTKWKVGHDYLDTEIGDVCALVDIIGKSSWCSTKPPEEQPPKLVFEYERYDRQITVDPNDPSGEVQERFIERYTRDPPRGAPAPPW